MHPRIPKQQSKTGQYIRFYQCVDDYSLLLTLPSHWSPDIPSQSSITALAYQHPALLQLWYRKHPGVHKSSITRTEPNFSNREQSLSFQSLDVTDHLETPTRRWNKPTLIDAETPTYVYDQRKAAVMSSEHHSHFFSFPDSS